MPDMEMVFDPENIDMLFCPLCNGEGKLPDGQDGIKVCPQCQGFGIIKKKEMTAEKTIAFRGVRITLPK